MGFFRKVEDEIKDVGRKIDKELIRPVVKTVEAVVTDPKKLALVVAAIYLGPIVATKLGATTGLTGAKLAAATGATMSGGTALLTGASAEEALKAALVGGLTAGASAGYADTIGQNMGFEAGSVASKAAGNAVIAAAKAEVTDEAVLESMVTAAVTSALSNKTEFDATEFEGSLAKPGVDDYQMTNDFSGLNYDLTSGLTFPKTEGISYDSVADTGFDVGNSPVDYSLGINTSSGMSLTQSSSPNLTSMGGAQGVTADKDDGTTLSGVNDTGITGKDLLRGAKVAGALVAGDALIDATIGSPTSSLVTKPPKDIYRDAPLAGFRMVKYEDSATGASKYIPFVGEEALLPPPTGYTKSYAKGGLASRRT
jgi:hypothetical protein